MQTALSNTGMADVNARDNRLKIDLLPFDLIYRLCCSGGRTALHVACSVGDNAEVQRLLDFPRINVELRDLERFHELH